MSNSDPIINSGSLIKKRFSWSVYMVCRITCIQVYLIIGKVGIVHTHLNIEIIDIVIVQYYRSGKFIIKKMSIKLIREFKVTYIDLFIGPSNIKTCTYEASRIYHLMIGDRAINFCRSKIATACYIT